MFEFIFLLAIGASQNKWSLKLFGLLKLEDLSLSSTILLSGLVNELSIRGLLPCLIVSSSLQTISTSFLFSESLFSVFSLKPLKPSTLLFDLFSKQSFPFSMFYWDRDSGFIFFFAFLLVVKTSSFSLALFSSVEYCCFLFKTRSLVTAIFSS